MPSPAGAATAIGSIRVDIFERGAALPPAAVPMPGSVAATPSLQELDGEANIHAELAGCAALSLACCAGRKWWYDAGLTTQAGAPIPVRESWSPVVYSRGPRLAELRVQLETATTLLLRGVLQETIPAHAALLAQFNVPRAAIAARPSPASAAPAALPAAQGSSGGSPSQPASLTRAIKRELIDLGESNTPPRRRAKTAAAKPEVVDLTDD